MPEAAPESGPGVGPEAGIATAREIAAVPLAPDLFRPFGAVAIDAPALIEPWSGREGARAVIETLTAPGPEAPARHVLRRLERHPHSTQAFAPLDPAPYLVAVAPDAPEGGPDLPRLRAFVVPAGAVLQYRAAVWHAPITTLGPGGRFAMHVHKDGTPADCELRDIPPVAVRLEVPERRSAPAGSLGRTPPHPAQPPTGDAADAHA